MRGTLRKRSIVAACLLVLIAVAVAAGAASADVQIVDKANGKSKKPHPVTLATAATWVAVGPTLRLLPDQVAPEQFTDPSAPRVMQLSTLVNGLSLKGVAAQTFSRAALDPSDPSMLIGNYIVKAVVFRNAGDAKKFRAADSKEVTDHGALKEVAKYRDGVVLDDGQGHVNVMFTIKNVAVDVRTGVAENGAGTGVADAKNVAAVIVANSKKKR